MTTNNNEASGWTGWVYFAGIMMVVAGIFQMIAGLTALLNDEWFLVTQENMLVFDFTTWGWIHMILGLVVLMAGSAVMGGRTWGRVVGVFLSVLALFANLVFLPAYPVWSIIAIVVNVMVIYALTVHGREVA